MAHSNVNPFSPKAILANPDRLTRLIDTYFSDEAPDNDPTRPPSVAGLAYYLGFATPASLTEAIDYDSADEVMRAKSPPESIFALQAAVTRIEATLTRHALTNETNASFTKYTLGTRHGIAPPQPAVDPAAGSGPQVFILGVSDAAPVAALASANPAPTQSQLPPTPSQLPPAPVQTSQPRQESLEGLL